MAEFPSTERVTIAWLRTQTTLEPWLKETSGMWHVASRLRADLMPFVVIQKLPGGAATGEAPYNVSLIQVDSYAGNQTDLHQGSGESDDGPHFQPDLIMAQDIALEVYSLMFFVNNYETAQGVLAGCEVQEEPFKMDEPKLNVARFSFTALVSSKL